MPPCMGKTIAAVFLRLSAASVKGFLSWLLLSALLLQLSEPVSDALLFGRWGLPVGGLLGFHLAFPVGQVTAVLLDDLGCFFESGDKYLCVRIPVTFYL